MPCQLRSKLLYGLDSAQINDGTAQKLNAFQLKGLRQILGITTTHGQQIIGATRTHTNEHVYQQATEVAYPRGSTKKILPLSEVHAHCKLTLYCRLLTELHGSTAQEVTMHSVTLRPLEGIKRRAGHPRNQWATEAARDAWKHILRIAGLPLNWELNLKRPTHREALQIFARTISAGTRKVEGRG